MLVPFAITIIILQTQYKEISPTKFCSLSLSSCVCGSVWRYFKAGSSPCHSRKSQCARSFQVSVVMFVSCYQWNTRFESNLRHLVLEAPAGERGRADNLTSNNTSNSERFAIFSLIGHTCASAHA